MSRETVLARAQAAAEQGMVDTCTVKRVNGSSTNPETGIVSQTYLTVYAGKCRVQFRAVARARPQTVGEAAVLVDQLELHVPVTVVGVAPDDLVSITASVHDQDLLGRTWHIRELAHKSFLSARRFSMIEVTS